MKKNVVDEYFTEGEFLVDTIYKLTKIRSGLEKIGRKLNVIKVPDRVLSESETHVNVLSCNGRHIRCLKK